ncbi:T-complex protein 1 subunit alpha [Arachis hypogaea]|nr:T-complex protein 1 subunit alpha [Arachis hypogaea]
MSSKLISGDNDFFANLVVEVVQVVKMTNARGEVKYPIKGINILKAHGKSARDSFLMNGYALNTGRAAQGMPLRVAPTKIARLDFNLQKTKMQLGVQVLVTDPRELEKIRQREADMTKERIEKLLKAGANVVLTTNGIDDMALKFRAASQKLGDGVGVKSLMQSTGLGMIADQTQEGVGALWTGIVSNIARSAIINAAELASYDQVKQINNQHNVDDLRQPNRHAIPSPPPYKPPQSQ